MRTLRLGLLPDLHLAPPGTAGERWHGSMRLDISHALLSRALARLIDFKVEALLLAGDLVQTPDTGEYGYLRAQLDATGLPVCAVPGNHDDPDLVDDMSDHTVSWLPENIHLHAGTVRHEGADWVGAPASAVSDGLLLWVSHFPILDISQQLTTAGLKHAGNLANRASLETTAITIASDASMPVVILTGHLHVRAHATRGNVLQLNNGALIEMPHELTVLEIAASEEGEYDVTRTAIPLDPAESIPRWALDPDVTAFHWSVDTQWRRS